MFEREELIRIRNQAQILGDTEGVNPSWRQALYNLATAADHLDAMIVRVTVNEIYDETSDKTKTQVELQAQ